MLTETSQIQALVASKIASFDAFCSQFGLLGKVKADHFGLRCSSKEIYEKQRELFSFHSRFMYESIISKRRISIVGLSEEVETSVGGLAYLELSDQKPDGSQVDQFDHIEIVPTSISYDELVETIRSQGGEVLETIRPHHTTHDIVLPSGFIVKLSREMLIDKIKREEMK